VVDLRGAGTTVDPSMVKQGGPCPFVNGQPQCGQAFRMERNQPCPLDANGMPECGAPVGEQMPSANAAALRQYNRYDPSALPAPPSPPGEQPQPSVGDQIQQTGQQLYQKYYPSPLKLGVQPGSPSGGVRD
jgi:hypothetical protein